MTSASTSPFPQHFSRIDELTRQEHAYLTEADNCFFIGEYTAEQGYAYSETNSLISNFKKGMERQGLPEWPYKERDILRVADVFRASIPEDALNHLTFVPIPPSKAKDDLLYDDRLTRMLNLIRPNPPLDVRELIVQAESTEAVHISSEKRPTPTKALVLFLNDTDGQYDVGFRQAGLTMSQALALTQVSQSVLPGNGVLTGNYIAMRRTIGCLE